MIEEQSANVVVVPTNARVDHFQQLWLVKNGIVSEESQGVFTPVAVQCRDVDIDFLFLPNRIQISCAKDIASALEAVSKRMKDLLGAAGASVEPLQGCGVNVRIVLSEEKSEPKKLEDVFFKPNPFFEVLTSDRVMHFSTVEELQQLKLTTKVESARHMETGRVGVIIDLNFHHDCTSSDEAIEFISRSRDFIELASQRIQSINSSVSGK